MEKKPPVPGDLVLAKNDINSDGYIPGVYIVIKVEEYDDGDTKITFDRPCWNSVFGGDNKGWNFIFWQISGHSFHVM